MMDEAITVVDQMDLEEGHTLSESEASAIHDILQLAVALRNIQSALGIVLD